MPSWGVFCFVWRGAFVLFEIGSPYVVQASLELTV